MEKLCCAAGRVWLVSILLVSSLLISGALADGEGKDAHDPRKNVNLSPFQQWISVIECLQNTSDACSFNSKNYTLTFDGWMNVTKADGEAYCKEGGCKDHSLAVLDCVRDVKRDAWFRNGATLKDINDTITYGCSNGFNGTTRNSHKK